MGTGSSLKREGAKHVMTNVYDYRTVSLTAAAEDTNVIDVTVQLTDIDGNSVSSADAWVAEVVGEPAGDYTVAETGAGAEVSQTGHNALVFTLSSAGAATISVTDVSGGSNEDVVLLCRPADSFAKPQYVTLTFD